MEGGNGKQTKYGSKLSILDNEQATRLLKKYRKTIHFQCRKRSFIPGKSVEDLEQECRIRIVAGYHQFKKSKSMEKTWVHNVVRHTLDSIWNQALKQKRACHLETEDGLIPVYDYSYDSMRQTIDEDGEENLDSAYYPCEDGRPTFGTAPSNPEQEFMFASVLSFLKTHLPEDTFAYISSKVFPDPVAHEIRDLENKFKEELQQEGLGTVRVRNDFEIWCVMSDVTAEETKMLCQTAQLMIDYLGFNKEDILAREDMVSAVL